MIDIELLDVVTTLESVHHPPKAVYLLPKPKVSYQNQNFSIDQTLWCTLIDMHFKKKNTHLRLT